MSYSFYQSSDQFTYRRPYSCEILWDVAQTSTVNVNQKILTSSSTNCTEIFDTSPNKDMFNQSSQRIDIKKDGLYLLKAKVYTVSSGNKRWTMFYVNGTRLIYAQGFLGGGTTSDTVNVGSVWADLNSGDFAELYFTGSATNNLGTTDSLLSNRFTVIYFGVG